jgi:hypothetical protein
VYFSSSRNVWATRLHFHFFFVISRCIADQSREITFDESNITKVASFPDAGMICCVWAKPPTFHSSPLVHAADVVGHGRVDKTHDDERHHDYQVRHKNDEQQHQCCP